jgi:acyl-CoA thioester hydrolase
MTPISPFQWRRRVGMRDVDAWGNVWHGNYFAFCDEARSELLRAFDLAPGTLLEWGYVAPVVEAHCRFAAPAPFDEMIDVHVRVRIGRSTRLHCEFRLERTTDCTLLAEITTTQVLVKTSGDLVYLVPPEIAKGLERMIAAQQQLEAGEAQP